MKNKRYPLTLRSVQHRAKSVGTFPWVLVFALIATGLVMIYSSSFIYAQEKFKDGLYFFKRHLFFLALGFSAFAIAWKIPLGFLRKNTYLILGFATLAVLATLIPGLAHKVGGASRWLSIAGFTFQPSEPAKLAVILFVSCQLAKKTARQHNWASGFLTYFAAALPLYYLLLEQPDFGTTTLCVLTTFLLLILCGIKLKYLLPSIIALIPLVTALIMTSPYRMNRIQAFLNPWSDPSNKGFQVIQSFLAFYSGGLFGVGLGNSRLKLFYLPEAHNDFIFAVIGEELGLIGVLFFLVLFLVLIFKGLQIAKKSGNLYEKALAAGITIMLGLQIFFNMAVVVGLLPTKGLPLPLISYGGTSLVVTLFLLGLLAQLSEKVCSK